MNTFCVSQLTTNLLNSLKQILLLRLKNEANTFLSQLSILFEGLKILRTGFSCQIFWRAFLTFFFFFFFFFSCEPCALHIDNVTRNSQRKNSPTDRELLSRPLSVFIFVASFLFWLPRFSHLLLLLLLVPVHFKSSRRKANVYVKFFFVANFVHMFWIQDTEKENNSESNVPIHNN